MTPVPLTQDLVLVGGGHAHALVLRRLGMSPVPGLRITLINPDPTAPYTGMLPGHIAGHYPREALEIDLYRLARFAGARLLTDRATGLDTGARTIALASGRTVAYDVAALDIGVSSELPDLPGFDAFGVSAKPLGPLADRWRAFVGDGGADAVAVIGGGVAGIELALAMAHRLRAVRPGASVSVIERDHALGAVRPAVAGRLLDRLRKEGIALLEGARPERLTATGVELAGGEFVRSAFTVSAAGARPHAWLEGTGLALEGGYVTVDRYLRSSDARIFASGDCAHLSHAPRPKAGVYAVRAAPVLAANLVSAVAGGPKRAFRPQRDYLKLVSLGERAAVGERSGITVEGDWVWRLKDRIDRRFMDRLNAPPAMPGPPLPARIAEGVRDEIGGTPMLCGACGAKVGPEALSSALAGLPAPLAGLIRAPGDDAAILVAGGERLVLTTDHLAAFTGDYALMARIAALHAIGDVLAMGASPVAALAQITIPRMSAALQRRTLGEIMDAASAAFEEAGAAIAGGHTTQGSGLSIGFSITGRVGERIISLDGARAGDVLVLSRPIGSGVLLAADMALKSRGGDLDAMFREMARPQTDVAHVLSSARAMTDVTGFGLAGHAMNIARASGLSVRIDLAEVPLYRGALDAARAGVRSSLWRANRQPHAPDLPEGPLADLMFDPQTAGGLLAAVDAAEAADVVARLDALGHTARVVGAFAEGPARVTFGR